MEHPKKNKAENTTPKNTTIIDSPIKKPESKIVYAEDLAKDLNNKAVDTNQEERWARILGIFRSFKFIREKEKR